MGMPRLPPPRVPPAAPLLHFGVPPAERVCGALSHPTPHRSTTVIVPPPHPTYTLSPDVAPLTADQQEALEACLAGFTGRLSGVVVTAAATTLSHHMIELATPAGTLLVMERVIPPRASRVA